MTMVVCICFIFVVMCALFMVFLASRPRGPAG